MTTDTTSNLHDALRELRAKAQKAPSGRAAHKLSGGPDSHLTQTVIAMSAGTTLAEHENPGEATLIVLEGAVRLQAGDESWEGRNGDLLPIPDARHSVEALLDSAVLLTAVKRV